MRTIFLICMAISMLGVLIIMGLGVFSMTRGGEFSKKYSNRLMQARIFLQGAALIFFALAMFSGE